MSQVETALDSRVVAVYPDHPSAEAAVKRLIKEGFDMKDVSIVGRDFQVEEAPIGFVSARDFIGVGAGTGAWVGGLFGLLVGAAFLVLPGVGPVVIAGPLSAALLGGLEGALAGAAMGALSGALIGLGVPKNEALKYEAQVKAGKFLVIVHGPPERVERAKSLLSSETNEGVQVFQSEEAA
ncbi:MAG: hypothetical protein JWN86_2711 [Planctomycetota bacterium]|nr:hypothetical protein [Planctomycetota bacterium]